MLSSSTKSATLSPLPRLPCVSKIPNKIIDMQDKFKITTEFYGQTAKADCRVELCRFLYLTMTAPYKEIKTTVLAFDAEGYIRQFYDRQEAQECACRALETIIAYIHHVKQYRREYNAASSFYKQLYAQRLTEFRATEASKQRGCLERQSELTSKVLKEYRDLVCRLIPTANESDIIKPDLLVQILTVI